MLVMPVKIIFMTPQTARHEGERKDKLLICS